MINERELTIVNMQDQNSTFVNFSLRLQSASRKLGIEQKELARRTGITAAAINNYWTKERVPKSEELFKICKALGVTMEWLLTGEQDLRQEFAERLRGRMEGMKLAPAEFAGKLKVPPGEVVKWLAGEIPAKEEYRAALRRMQFEIEKFPAQAGPSVTEVNDLKNRLVGAEVEMQKVRESLRKLADSLPERL